MYNSNFYGMVPGNQPNYGFQGENDFRDVISTCQKLMNYHVIGHMNDGSQVEGIIEDMDDEGVTMLVPETVDEEPADTRIYGGFGGYGGYGGYGGGYGGYRRRFRRFRRRHFPYYTFVFPFILPYPYYY